jgi:hypothetical protein
MKKFFLGLLGALAVMGAIAFAALIGGTIVYLIWPVCVPVALPGLVTAGTIAGSLTWWQSVCLTWLCAILIKSSHVTNNNK